MWSDKKGDVYLSTRSLGSRLKASFHRDRRCSVGFTTEYAEAARERFGTASRHWDRWSLPQQPVVRIAQIVYPFSDLTQFQTDDASPMAWIPISPQDDAAVVSIFVAEPPSAFDWNGPESGNLLGYMHAPTRLTWVVHTSQKLDPALLEYAANARRRAEGMPGSLPVPRNDPAVRMFLWGNQSVPHDIFFLALR